MIETIEITNDKFSDKQLFIILSVNCFLTELVYSKLISMKYSVNIMQNSGCEYWCQWSSAICGLFEGVL